MTNILIRDITDPVNQLVNYGKQKVGFYDGFKPTKADPETGELGKSDNPTLYIYINNPEDKFSIVRRAAGKIRIKTSQGRQLIDETKAYARAYQKYLDLKSNVGVQESENELLKAKIAQLEAAQNKPEEEEVELEEPVFQEEEVQQEEEVEVTELVNKSNKELKAELDQLGVEYKGNASKETLLELIANNKE